MGMEHALPHFARWLGDGWETAPPTDLTGWRVCELLWPLNDIFRPRLEEVRALPYDARWCAGADFAIDAAADAGDLSPVADADPRVLRVLYERHTQTLTAAGATSDERFTRVPRDLSEDQQRLAVMLIVLHSMELPWPPGGPRSAGSQSGGRGGQPPSPPEGGVRPRLPKPGESQEVAAGQHGRRRLQTACVRPSICSYVL